MGILVTGGAGFIGSHLVDRLLEQGHKVKIIDNLSSGSEKNLNPKAEFFNLDIRDLEKITPVFKDTDYVFHLAAIPRVPLSIKEPVKTSETNIFGTINVFKACAEYRIKRVVFASSSSVYGNQERLPLKEDMTPNPLSPYGLQKLVGEQFTKIFFSLYNLPVVCLRYFNVYGPRIDFNSDYSLVIGKFLKQKAQGKPLTIYGDGEQARGFCYVDDVVGANIKAMKSEKIKGGEVINIGSNKSYSINYLAKLIGGEKKYLPPREGDPLHTKANITLAKKLLGWEPKITFEQGLEKTREWFTGQNPALFTKRARLGGFNKKDIK
ncbi:MAG: SDR family oxidoreductase [Candidatus Nealsonbacteria bacterium]|nr:SDR family oxidoreductase [Candidatus Nealsonbacteria bacterium]